MTGQSHTYSKTRIAPTPSGFLHLGNILSFAITASLAHKHEAKILLRIDDLDQARVNNDYLKDIFDTLNFLSITWQQGPKSVEEFEENHSQLHRMELYQKALDKLQQRDLVFACTCSRQQMKMAGACNCLSKKIPLNTIGASWRLITNNAMISVREYKGQTYQARLPADMQNFIVRKKDGFPAYQLTSVVDDLFYGVDLVVRGQDLLASTLAQHQLALALGKDEFSNIIFYHHPLLMEGPGKKLSKSAGSTSVNYLRKNGSSKAEIYSMIAGMMAVNENVTDWQQLANAVRAVL